MSYPIIFTYISLTNSSCKGSWKIGVFIKYITSWYKHEVLSLRVLGRIGLVLK